MGGIFSKGSSAPAPQMPMTAPESPDFTPILEAMMGMMEAMSANTMSMMQSMSSMQTPQLPPIPEINVPEPERNPEVDWTEKQEQLAKKMQGDYALEADRKGRLETVLTSPLLDEEDAMVDSSVLAGK